MNNCMACGVEIHDGRQFCPKCASWFADPDIILQDGTPLHLKTPRNPNCGSLQLELYDLLKDYRRNVEED